MLGIAKETNDVRKFSIDEWYPIFKDVALKTVIYEIEPELLAQLQKDHCDADAKKVCSVEYVNQIKNTIHQFNNEAFVKNNWHAPVDAKFVSFGNTLKVTNVDDVILYLNASDIVMNDFSVKDAKFCIALRPWMNIHPAAEFRCIVINNVLRGITPRDWLTFYPHFLEEGKTIVEEIRTFYERNVKEKFSLRTYTFDVIMPTPGEILVVDFGPLNQKTKLYAFNWKEIQPLMQKDSSEAVAPVFRYLESDLGILTPFLQQKMHIV